LEEAGVAAVAEDLFPVSLLLGALAVGVVGLVVLSCTTFQLFPAYSTTSMLLRVASQDRPPSVVALIRQRMAVMGRLRGSLPPLITSLTERWAVEVVEEQAASVPE
jgi:hypothetical protein